MTTDRLDHADLDLPPIDGDGDTDEAHEAQTPDALEDAHESETLADPFDDATGEGSPIDASDAGIEGTEAGWLVDTDEASNVELGGLDLAFGAGEAVLDGDDEADGEPRAFDDLVVGDEVSFTDAGEEGPLADDEELREEDLPALDADADGDVPDADLLDRSILGETDDLRWDDRAWARDVATNDAGDEPDDSGALAVPSDDPAQSARDTTWRRLDESGRVTAAIFVPGDSVVVALATPDRAGALLVRIQPDGAARIIAEIERGMGSETEDEVDCRVAFLRWDAARGCLLASGAFGTQAFRPAGLSLRPVSVSAEPGASDVAS